VTSPLPDEEFPVDTLNEYVVVSGTNLPNHSTSLEGRGKFVKVASGVPPVCRTKQQVFRLCAWLMSMAEILPDEPGEHSYEQVLKAVHNA